MAYRYSSGWLMAVIRIAEARGAANCQTVVSKGLRSPVVSDVIALIILALVATLPITGFLLARWGFEEADGHESDPLARE